MKKSKVLIVSFLIISLTGIFLADFSQAQENYICAVYITGIGCPNCAIIDPVVLSEWTQKYPNLVVIEYEIYKNHEENYPPADKYFKNYIPEGVRPGIPLLILNKENVFLGRFEVLEAENRIKEISENKCPLSEGTSQKFEDLDPNNLSGKPSIWANGEELDISQSEPETIAAISESVGDNKNNWPKYLYLLIPIALFVLVLIILFSKKKRHEPTH